MTVTALYEVPLGVCTQDPDRWTTTPDDEAKTLCRACPRRWLCARDAVESAGAEGLWAGVVIPESGRARAFALGQLRSLAERNGYPVRDHRVCLPNRHDATAAWTAGSRGLRNSGGEMPWMWTAREHRQDFSRCPHCAPRCARQDSTMGAEIDVLQACARAILLLPTGSASQVTGAGCRVRRRVATRSTPSPSRRPAGFSAASSGPFRGSYR